MARSHTVHPNLQLVDITSPFRGAINGLSSGQLVKDDSFTLFEAVGALEIGDPKMDSGCLEFEGDAEDEINVLGELSPVQVIWMIDQLLRREVAWHQGYPLSQTLFTSIHLDKLLWPDPKTLDEADFHRVSSTTRSMPHEILRAYCLGLIKCCDLVLGMITSQHYYEEEDFATQLYNRELLHRFDSEDVFTEIQKARASLTLSGWSTEKIGALEARLDHRLALLKLLTGNALSQPPQLSHVETISFIDKAESTTELGQELSGAFSIKLQRRLASSVPPRPMVTVDGSVAFDFMRQLVYDISAVFELYAVSSPGDLFTAFWTLMSQTAQPSVYVRTLAQSFLSVNDRLLGIYTVKDLIVDDLQALVLPDGPLLDPANEVVENPFDERFRMARQLDSFVAKSGPSHINQLRSFCQNRCRVRRNLCHALLEWDNMQADAEEIDGILQTLTNETPIPYPDGEALTFSYSLSSWVYHYKLMQLRLEVQMGFELSVFASHENPSMYWYLSHLASLHLSHLERISHFVSKSSGQQSDASTTLQLVFRHFSYLKAVDTLSSALHRVFVLLQRHGHISRVKHGYASEALRFELRMRPFQFLSIPEPLSHEEMDKLTNLHSLSDRQILDQAARLSSTSKKAWEEVLKAGWNFSPLRQPHQLRQSSDGLSTPVIEREWTKDVRNCMRASIGTSITITALSRALEGASGSPASAPALRSLKVTLPEPEDPQRFHKWWAVPKILL